MKTEILQKLPSQDCENNDFCVMIHATVHRSTI